MKPHQWNWRSNSWGVPGWTFNHGAAYSHPDIEIFYSQNLLSVLFFLRVRVQLLNQQISNLVLLETCLYWFVLCGHGGAWVVLYLRVLWYSWGAFLKNSYRGAFSFPPPLPAQLPQHWANRVFIPFHSNSGQVRVGWVTDQTLRTT